LTAESTDEDRGIASSAALTSASQIVTMATTSLLGLVILLRFGTNQRTDGFFAAFGVYGVITLIEGRSLFAEFDRFLGAIILIFLFAAVPLVLAGDVLAGLLTSGLGHGARSTARLSLAVFWLAGGAQLAAALGAAALGVRNEFGLPALAYMAGSLVSLVLVLLLSAPLGVGAVPVGAAAGVLITAAFVARWLGPRRDTSPTALAYLAGGLVSIGIAIGLSAPLGIVAVPVGIGAGSFLTSLLMIGRLVSAGYRPRPLQLASRDTLRRAGVVISGAVGYMFAQASFVITLGFAATIGAGAVTLYSYADFGLSVIVSATSGSIAIVLAAPLAREWDRRPESLDPHLRTVFRGSVALMVPTIALVALIGRDVLAATLGGVLGDRIDSLVATFLGLSGTMIASAAAPVPTIAAFALARYGAVGVITATSAAFHFGVSYLAVQTQHLAALSVAWSMSTIFSFMLLLGLVYGRKTPGALRLLGAELGKLALLGVVAFGPLGLAGSVLAGAAGRGVAAMLGIVTFAVLMRMTLPDHWALLGRVAQPIVRKLRPSGVGEPAQAS
jgi:hypothetical protein